MAFDIVTYALLKKSTSNEINKILESLAEGMKFKGEVATWADLPENPKNGDLYIISQENKKAVYDGTKWIAFDAKPTKISELENDENYIKADGVTPTIKAAAGTNIGAVGTPSVTAATSGNTTTFTFDYLKGARGPKGDKGDTGPQGPKGDKGESNKSEVDALGKRIDNLILSSGTESSAEVVDARNGYDGTTYDTLGTAIRSQVSELKSDLSNITDGGFFGVEFDYIEGGYIDSITGEVVSYETWKYTDFIDISERENNAIYLMTDGVKSVYNVFYDANKARLCSRADDIGVLDETYIPANAKYVRLSCRLEANQTLKIYKTKRATMADIEKVKNEVKNEVKNAIQISTYLKVATYNVGIFNNGISGVETENAIDKMNEFRKIIGSINADILNTQEFKEYFDLGNTYSSLDVVNFKYPHNTKSINKNNLLSFLKYPITNAVKKAFDSGSGKYYVAFDITVGGKTITVINVHLAIEEDVSVHRSSEIAELITFMDTKDYVILTGDMNASSQSEYDAYKTAGYRICNGGDFGWFNTWPIRKNMPSSWNTTWPCENLDNIIVSDNITPQYVEKIDCVISDHAPLVATLRID